ncbi:MAG: N-acetylmuramic acid 6-phosphate etherase [Clostridia bacterium]|nr:N-acetylmuramic acid 6-phosphate etherase [Deltaproteobacteria bacterium]
MSTTETVDPRFEGIDLWPTAIAVEAMLEGQLAAIAAIQTQVTRIAQAGDAAAERLMRDGRLIYVGAGTSARIAVQDGVELGPTFNWPHERLAYVIAGGLGALSNSIEGAEDNSAAAREEIEKLQVGNNDVVIGVAASGRTPFTIAAVKAARDAGALTIGVSNNPHSLLDSTAEIGIVAATGSELVAGSTRMKAGTAQKAILNLISTTVMLRLGKVYRGLMVSMVISNDKLLGRAHAMVATIAGCKEAVAVSAVGTAKGDIRKAVLIALGLSERDAGTLLAKHSENLRSAIEDMP